MFTREDFAQMEEHGVSLASVWAQLQNFQNGFPPLPVVRAASVGDGIRVLAPEQIDRAVERYEREADRLRIVKFVPASGAATRMFKDLFEFLREGRRNETVGRLLAHLEQFAFYPELQSLIPSGADDRTIVKYIVERGLPLRRNPPRG